MRKAGRLTWKEENRAIRQMEGKRVGARDRQKEKSAHRGRCGHGGMLCAWARTRPQPEWCPRVSRPRCVGGGHFPSFLPPACLQVAHRPVSHKRPKAARGIPRRFSQLPHFGRGMGGPERAVTHMRPRSKVHLTTQRPQFQLGALTPPANHLPCQASRM